MSFEPYFKAKCKIELKDTSSQVVYINFVKNILIKIVQKKKVLRNDRTFGGKIL